MLSSTSQANLFRSVQCPKKIIDKPKEEGKELRIKSL
jgi:hypothetical protein